MNRKPYAGGWKVPAQRQLKANKNESIYVKGLVHPKKLSIQSLIQKLIPSSAKYLFTIDSFKQNTNLRLIPSSQPSITIDSFESTINLQLIPLVL